MKVTFIRHTSVDVPIGICYGQTDVDVSANFETEALKVADKLKNSNFDGIYCSPLQRCLKLAHYCGFKQPVIDHRLMEINFGDWEMQAWNDINDLQLQKWFDNWVTEKPTNGESFASQIDRIQSFILDLKQSNQQHVAIFTHAGVIRSFGIINKLFSIENSFQFSIQYADIIEIDC